MRPFILALLTAAFAASFAKAQETLDVAKITCEQFVLYQVTDSKYIAIWIWGYHNGQRNNTIVDPLAFEKNFEKVKDYCAGNLTMPVMQAVDVALNLKK